MLIWNVPLAFLTCFAAIPFVSWGLGEPIAVTLGFMGLFLILVTKRLQGNSGMAELSEGRRRVLLNRFLFDRDISDKRGWVHRELDRGGLAQPQNSQEIGHKAG